MSKSPEITEILQVEIPEDVAEGSEPCCSTSTASFSGKIEVEEEISAEMPATRSTQIKIEVTATASTTITASSVVEEEEEMPSPRALRRRRTDSFSPVSPTRSQSALKRPKPESSAEPEDEEEPEDYNYGLEEEAEESESDESSRAPSPRIIPKRNCAEQAKKKIKIDITIKARGEKEEKQQSESATDSREGSCERCECALMKICCLNTTENCIASTSDPSGKNYHHLSKNEHVCVVCYDALWKAAGRWGKKFNSWKAKWSEESRCHPGVKAFLFDQILPYWIECQNCRKYRKYETEEVPAPKFLAKFKCDDCEEEEDEAVLEAKERNWIYSINACPLLQNSPALFYLRGGHYFYDELGMSPVEQTFEAKDCRTERFMSPFNIPDQQSKAFCLRPDMMDYDEVVAFPEYSIESVLYLATRNLIVTLWNMNPFEYLTLEKCIPHLICRGLARVWYIQELERIHEFLRIKSIINYGILNLPSQPKDTPSMEVIIVGAGISGLSAARQLRSFGCKVKVLEAKNIIGGRMQDDWSLGVAVGCGAQLVTGSINNPIILMCEQTGVKYRIVESQCPLIDGEKGGLVHWKTDKYVEEHLNCILDALYHWKNETKHGDASLEGKIQK